MKGSNECLKEESQSVFSSFRLIAVRVGVS
jgi:hypothetical protein